MYAYFTTQRRVFPRYYQESFLGLPLLRAELPRRGRKSRWEKKALAFLRRNQVRTLLNGPEQCAPLRLLDTGELYRRTAPELALLTLRRQRILPEKAVVGLLGTRWTRELDRAARRLAGQVRCLSLSLPGSQDLAWELQQEFGIPVFQGDGDLTLCFSPAQPGPGRLLLGSPRPRVEGISFRWKGGPLPEDVPADALLTLLARSGIIPWGEILVEPAEPRECFFQRLPGGVPEPS